MTYAIITLCLIYMAFLVASFIFKFVRANRVGRLKLVKGYAKGRFVLIYICAVPLFFIASLRDGAKVIEAIFSAVEASVELVVLKLDYSTIATLAETNSYFSAVMVILFVLCVINIAMVSLALFYQKLVNYIYLKKATQKGAKTYVIVGANDKNRDVLTSAHDSKIWIVEPKDRTSELDEFAYINKIAVVKLKEGRLDATLKGMFSDFTDRTVKVIINTDCDETNLLYTEEATEIINSIDIARLDIDDERGLNVYVFGEPENGSAFLHFVKKSSGQVRYINKYKLIALDFTLKHPLTEYMGEEEIDYESATLKNDVDLNVVMVGYNKTMQEVLVTSIANNQFATLENGSLIEKAVNYSIFAKKDGETTEKNLNHTYYRYVFDREEMLNNSDKYLALPEVPANVNFVPKDVNDHEFYKCVKEALVPKKDRRVFNQIIVAYGSDIENVDISEKLSIKIKEWGIEDKTKVYVKVRSRELAERIIKDEYKEVCALITFAGDKDVVYNTRNIVAEDIETMARDRHLAYAVCDALQEGKSEKEAKANALKKWYSWAQPQRDANVYGVLSIRMKLNLMGYDYQKGEQNEEINNAFMAKYQKGDEIVYKEKIVGEKKLIEYNNNFVKGSLRERMAIQEHQRWNAYMITQGVIPSTKEEIAREKGKNLTLRRHGCLTTFDGLLEYRAIMAKANDSNEELEDVIRYDYQLLDDVIWLLKRNGMALIKK